MVAREQQEQPVADRVERERPSLPDAKHVGLEDAAADVVDLEVAFEAGVFGEAGGIDRLDRGQMLPIRRELAEHRVAPAVAERVVVVVDPEVRRGNRVVAHEPSEARLDEVVEALVERPGLRRPSGRGSAGSRCSGMVTGLLAGFDRSGTSPTAWRAAWSGGRGDRWLFDGRLVSASASRVAWIAVSISEAATSWCATART